jgi:hypothetical protein
MRRLIFSAGVIAMLAMGVFAQSNPKSHAVRGHTTKKGTYVAPTRATNPNRTKRDNYSTKGNTNPKSGRRGTRNP